MNTHKNVQRNTSDKRGKILVNKEHKTMYYHIKLD